MESLTTGPELENSQGQSQKWPSKAVRSALAQQADIEVQLPHVGRRASFDHLVSLYEHGARNGDPESLRGPHVDCEF